MLIKDPQQFAEIAREWAVQHAGAPRKRKGQSSGGGAGNDKRRQREKAASAQEEAARAAAYVLISALDRQASLTILGMAGTTQISSIASS